MSDEMRRRIAMLTALVEKAPGQRLGRTAIMKLFYLLVALRQVPLGYYFTLYAYGPFDSTVLEDIDYAARLGAVTVETRVYPSGYGYVIQPGATAAATKQLDAEFVATHQENVDWVITEFGGATAVELELVSTIVYVDQECSESGHHATVEQLVDQVSEIKRHFTPDAIQNCVENLQQRRLLASLVT